MARPTEVDWQVHESELIKNNHEQFVTDCYSIHDKFKQKYADTDSTSWHFSYNVFALASPMPLWYELYSVLRNTVREYCGNQPLWFQSWLNFHKVDEVLDWHTHDWPYHGYIAIDPCKSTTVFEGYKIENKIGNIYIGPGDRAHKVRVDEEFDSTRITLGFDVTDNPNSISSPEKHWSILPLL